VALVSGALEVFLLVAYTSYLPALVGPEQLMDGNGKLSTTQSMAQAAGPGLGALLVGLTGAAVALGSDALSFAASAARLLAIRRREPRHTAAARQARPGFRAEAGAGLSYVLREPILRRAVAWNGTANFFVIMVETLDPVFLIRAVHLRPAYVGVLLALGAAGGVAAGLAARPLTRRIGSARISWLSMTVFSLPGLLIPLAGPGWRVLCSRLAGSSGRSAPRCAASRWPASSACTPRSGSRRSAAARPGCGCICPRSATNATCRGDGAAPDAR